MRHVLNTADIVNLIDYIDSTLNRYGFRGWKGLVKLEKYSMLYGEETLESLSRMMQSLMMNGSKGLSKYLSDENNFVKLINEIIKLEDSLKKLLNNKNETLFKLASILDGKGYTSDASLFYLEYINGKIAASTGLYYIQSPIESLRLIQKNIPSLSNAVEHVLSNENIEYCFPGSICLLNTQPHVDKLRTIAMTVREHSFDSQESKRIALKLIKERIKEISKSLVDINEPIVLISQEDLTRELLEKSDPKILLLFNNKDATLDPIVNTLEYTSMRLYREDNEDAVQLSLEYIWIKSNAARLRNELVKYYTSYPIVALHESLESIYDVLVPDYSPGLKLVDNKIQVCSDIYHSYSCLELDNRLIETVKEVITKKFLNPFEVMNWEKIIRKIGFSIFNEIL